MSSFLNQVGESSCPFTLFFTLPSVFDVFSSSCHFAFMSHIRENSIFDGISGAKQHLFRFSFLFQNEQDLTGCLKFVKPGGKCPLRLAAQRRLPNIILEFNSNSCRKKTWGSSEGSGEASPPSEI